MKRNVIKGIKQVAKGVKSTEERKTDAKKKQRLTPLKQDRPNNEGLAESQKAKRYETIKLTGSKGETYNVTVPASYVSGIPKTWEWNEERYRVAELIAEGIPISQIPDDPSVTIKSRMVIYCWLEHPEFKEHIDGLVMETGWASRRERLMNLQRLNQRLLMKVMNEIDEIKLTDKSIGAVLSALQAGSKLIAQEKGEFIEESKVSQETNMTAKVANVNLKVDELLQGKADTEKNELEKEFDNMADDIIRSLTGDN